MYLAVHHHFSHHCRHITDILRSSSTLPHCTHSTFTTELNTSTAVLLLINLKHSNLCSFLLSKHLFSVEINHSLLQIALLQIYITINR